MLYIFGGLPAVGKSKLSKHLATSIQAAYLRIDTIEQQLKEQGVTNLYDQGYQVAFALALDNLKSGVSVVADSTNPVTETRDAWKQVAKQAECAFIEIEVMCSDKQEHQYRVENRQTDIPNLVLPSWKSVTSRDYQPWSTATLRIDTAGKTPQQSNNELLQLLTEAAPKLDFSFMVKD